MPVSRLPLVSAFLAVSSALAEPVARPAEPCRPLAYQGADYVVCMLDLRRYELKLFWKGPDGEPYGGFGRLTRAPDGRSLVFAMNAGMYQEDRSPVGLYVENGRELRKANTAAGPGNFHLKPNGVFYAIGDTAGVMETARYLKRRPRAVIATQSGPMLVIDGRLHPKIAEDGLSRKVRDGVGAKDPHTVVFAISEAPVTFGQFAHLFRDALGARNALFLDGGSVPGLYAPGLNRSDGPRAMGPIVGAVERAPAR